MKDRNYRRSNQIECIKLYVSKTAKRLAGEILLSQGALERQKLSNELLFELDQLSEIKLCTVEITDVHQKHKRSGGRLVYKEYGHYKPARSSIHITNLTAVQKKPLAPKTFLDTLLHEWMHHYDTHALKLNSIHTKGFYARLAHLKKKLLH
ncbi:hypothetical protein HON52_00840 [Candidatus Uhrbacteria bacterium]|jgi:hypothetical protein|nr:hypothetical protein [Candidatus Uhrbacteria bacterium]